MDTITSPENQSSQTSGSIASAFGTQRCGIAASDATVPVAFQQEIQSDNSLQ